MSDLTPDAVARLLRLAEEALTEQAEAMTLDSQLALLFDQDSASNRFRAAVDPLTVAALADDWQRLHDVYAFRRARGVVTFPLGASRSEVLIRNVRDGES